MCFAPAREASLPPYPRPPAREMHVTRFLILPAGIPKLLYFKSLGEFLPVRVTNVSYIRPAARLAVRRRRPPRPRSVPQPAGPFRRQVDLLNFRSPKAKTTDASSLESIVFSDKMRCRNLATKWLGKRK